MPVNLPSDAQSFGRIQIKVLARNELCSGVDICCLESKVVSTTWERVHQVMGRLVVEGLLFQRHKIREDDGKVDLECGAPKLGRASEERLRLAVIPSFNRRTEWGERQF
jgi:hypothetical protein